MNSGVRGYIRQMVRQYLTDACTIEQEQVTVAATGVPSVAWVVVVSNVPCRLIEPRRKSSNEAMPFAGQDSIEEPYRLIVAHDVDLDTDMRVTIDGTVFYIEALDTSLTDRAFRSASITRKRGADG